MAHSAILGMYFIFIAPVRDFLIGKLSTMALLQHELNFYIRDMISILLILTLQISDQCESNSSPASYMHAYLDEKQMYITKYDKILIESTDKSNLLPTNIY